jgi:hypothetical protein
LAVPAAVGWSSGRLLARRAATPIQKDGAAEGLIDGFPSLPASGRDLLEQSIDGLERGPRPTA